jgi:hypothetical protein
MRHLFQETMETDVRAAVERLTGRKVLASAATTPTPTSPPNYSSSTYHPEPPEARRLASHRRVVGRKLRSTGYWNLLRGASLTAGGRPPGARRHRKGGVSRHRRRLVLPEPSTAGRLLSAAKETREEGLGGPVLTAGVCWLGSGGSWFDPAAAF